MDARLPRRRRRLPLVASSTILGGCCRTRHELLALAATVSILAAAACGGASEAATEKHRRGSVELAPCPELGSPDLLCGSHEVWEDRAAGSGRRIAVRIALLPATGERRDDPIVFLAGGPGASAVESAARRARSPWREHRDLLFLDQRGTGGSNRLDCPPPDDDPQRFLEPPFVRLDEIERCRDQLSTRADLRLYTTPSAVDDFDEIRAAMDYDQVNLLGGSYGTRAALVWMRRHPETIRTAILDGVAPLSFKNPLHHARSAQGAIEATFAECASDPACDRAFPDLPAKLVEVIARLERQPAKVSFEDPESGRTLELELSRDALASGLRVFSYTMPRARSLPRLVHQAWEGDLAPIAAAAFASTRGITEALAMGMLLSVTCPEDLARIGEPEIEAETGGTYLGPARVRAQLAACAVWPNGSVDDGYGDPVSVDVPTLLLSGTLDPVTPPEQGEVAARNLPRSLHLVVPGAHGVGGSRCLRSIATSFLERGEVDGLDTSCTAELTLPPFDLG
ncbi:MAG TPA: alpha/beta hydrolase [Thermoanaerobaculia bacterium]|nr:alpha/beta hydrolase [Thermoanaerobaculia bacterium]